MDKKHIEGTVDEAKGRAKEGTGAFTGNRDMKSEGKFDQLKGKAERAVGDIKDKLNPDKDTDDNR